MEILHLTKSTFTDGVADGTVLVDFWADWCGPCKMLAPVLEELFEEHSEEFRLAKVNVDEELELAEEFGIQSIPTVILFRGGKAELAAVGVRDKEVYAEMLTAPAE
jgi:thioredoxin 1